MLSVVEPIIEFESRRAFRVWRYSVSHSQLLLRSNRNDQIPLSNNRFGEHSTRIEVLFKGVKSMEVPTSMKGLDIRKEGDIFRLRGVDWSGHIEALVMFSIEDEGHFYDPSSLFIQGL
jgi:hypothetical protein